MNPRVKHRQSGRVREVCRLLLGALLVLLMALPSAPVGAQTNSAPPPFASEIAAFLQQDRTNPPPQNAILFIGSSIFARWENLKPQMAPLPVFNRAFGGSHTTDILFYLDKIVLPYQPRIIVYYCGSNDINAGENAPAIFDHFRQFVDRVHGPLPGTRIFYMSINRAPQKQNRWPVVDAANALARDYCRTDSRLNFIDVNPALFDQAGQPRLELYLPDKLHFKPAAYEEFTAIIKPVLTEAWRSLPPLVSAPGR